MSERIERRLTAILAADMVGYTRLMETDEEDVITRQSKHRKELFDPKIADYPAVQIVCPIGLDFRSKASMCWCAC